jgi:hypothetical protein
MWTATSFLRPLMVGECPKDGTKHRDQSCASERAAAAIDSLGAEMRLQYNLAMSFIVESTDQKLVQVKLVTYQRESP